MQIDTISYGMHILIGDKATGAKLLAASDYVAGVGSYMKQQPQTSNVVAFYFREWKFC